MSQFTEQKKSAGWVALRIIAVRFTSTCVLALIVATLASACDEGNGSTKDRTTSRASQPESGAPPWRAPSDPWPGRS